MAECRSSVKEEDDDDDDQEFLMDTEEQRRILGGGGVKRHIVYPVVRDPSSPFPKNNVGRYLPSKKGRICVAYCER